MATTDTADLAIEEVAVQDVNAESIPVGNLGQVTATFVRAGSSGAVAKKLLITGLSFATPTPAVVVLQPRQSVNQDSNASDQFAVQVLRTTTNSILCLIRRIDQATGWSQNLRLDIWVVERVGN